MLDIHDFYEQLIFLQQNSAQNIIKQFQFCKDVSISDCKILLTKKVDKSLFTELISNSNTADHIKFAQKDVCNDFFA